ncbi:MAG: rhomboid family intramembrane serine protease [Acidobacteriota bacterium]
MIPFRDNIPSRRYPLVTVAIIMANVAAFFYELSLGSDTIDSFIQLNGVIPAKLELALRAPIAVFSDTGRTMLWSMFLHGGWFHLIGNMWYLWIFGDNVEDRMGHFRFLGFYLLCGFIASAVHIAFNLDSRIPSIGASGAVAGVLGAYMISYPFARVLTLVPLFLIWPVLELPALFVLGFWFLVQFLNGAASLTAASQTAGGVAWWAHIGGFVAGILLLSFFAKPQNRRYSWKG